MSVATLDPEKQKQAKQYARIRRRMWLVDTLVSALVILAWLAFGWSSALKFISHQHTFSLIATNTQYTSADGIVAGSDQGPAETIIGFTITRQIAFE